MPLRRAARAAALSLALGHGAHASPPDFAALSDAPSVHRACDRSIAALRDAARALALHGSVLDAVDDLGALQEDVNGPVALLAAVHPAAAVRDAAEACQRRQQAFSTALLQDAAVFRRVRDATPPDAIDARLRQDLLDAFEDGGVTLPPAARRRVSRLSDELAGLEQQFQRRILEDRRRVAFTAEELDGVPPAVWTDAPRDAGGRYRLGLDAPTYQPVLDRASRRATRERMWRAGLTQGGTANLRTLDRLVRLRHELARLHGAPSYDAFVLRRRMAGDAATVQRFLADVEQAVAGRERDDLALLQAEQPGVPLARWDVPYQLDRVRRARYAVDGERLRRHFPPAASLEVAFAIAQRLFGVRFQAAAPAVLWHADARAYDAFDVDGAPLGTLYVDAHPREGKYNHAAVWTVRSGSVRTGRRPVVALVANLSREGLTLDELETLLHEFGHALHGLLSSTRHGLQSAAHVKFDFVEAPSQMLEAWAYDPRVLALFGAVCSGCPPVDDGVLARAWAAREFGKGIALARQRLFASYDLALHGPIPMPAAALWRRLERGTPLGHVAGSAFPAGFGHLAGGYAAGYYGYLWSLALAEDLRTAFSDDRLSADMGRRFRQEVLAPGAEAEPEVLVQRFLGRPAGHVAFFTALSRP